MVITYTSLDQGSTTVFCIESLMHKLHFTGGKGQILLRAMGQEKVISSYNVSGLDEDNFLELRELPHTIPCLCTEKILRLKGILKNGHI